MRRSQTVAGTPILAVVAVVIAACTAGRGAHPSGVTTTTTSTTSVTPTTVSTTGPSRPARTNPASTSITNSGPPRTDTPVASAPSTTDAPVTDVAAQRLFARSKAATAAVKTMRITGTETTAGATATLDLRFGEHNTAGHITRGGYTFDLIFAGRLFYFRAPIAFIRARFKNNVPPAVSKGVGKYVVSPMSSANAKPYAPLANRKALISGVYHAHPNLRRGPNRRIDGVICASLIDPGRGTFYVRADNALPVEIDARVAGGGHLTFSQLNRVPEPRAPAAGLAVDSNGDPV